MTAKEVEEEGKTIPRKFVWTLPLPEDVVRRRRLREEASNMFCRTFSWSPHHDTLNESFFSALLSSLCIKSDCLKRENFFMKTETRPAHWKSLPRLALKFLLLSLLYVQECRASARRGRERGRERRVRLGAGAADADAANAAAGGGNVGRLRRVQQPSRYTYGEQPSYFVLYPSDVCGGHQRHSADHGRIRQLEVQELCALPKRLAFLPQ